MVSVKNDGLARRLSKLNRWEDLLTPVEWRGYYHMLSGSEKVMYDKILDAIVSCQYYIHFSFPTVFSDEDVGRVLHFVLYDNPAIIDINEYDMWDILSDDHMTIRIPFTSLNSMVETSRRIDVFNAVKTILTENEMVYVQTDFDKELFVHDYICKNVEYDNTQGDYGNRYEPYSIFGPLIEKKAVCDGVSKLTKLLLELLGIRSYVVSGSKADPKKPKHAWNIVMLDEEAYHLDVTIDMCQTKATGGLLRRDFFNISDTVMERETMWDGKDDIWKCSSYELNYVYLVGGYVSSAEACREYIAKKLKEKRKLIYVRLNKKTLGDIEDRVEWVRNRYCEAAATVPFYFKGVFERSELDGLIVMHMEYIESR